MRRGLELYCHLVYYYYMTHQIRDIECTCISSSTKNLFIATSRIHFLSFPAVAGWEAFPASLAVGTTLVLKYTWYDALVDYPDMPTIENVAAAASDGSFHDGI